MTVDTRDILLKAAEDVQSGMWCKHAHFYGEREDPGDAHISYVVDLWGVLSLDEAIQSRRCAEGSLGLATVLLGGTFDDFSRAVEKVEKNLNDVWALHDYNDFQLPDDPFEAGQQLAELFRMTAEAL